MIPLQSDDETLKTTGHFDDFDSAEFDTTYIEDVPVESSPPPHDASSDGLIHDAPSFEELTLAQFVGQFWRTPRMMFRTLWKIVSDESASLIDDWRPTVIQAPSAGREIRWQEMTQAMQLGAYCVAFAFALWGAYIWGVGINKEHQLQVGLPFVFMAMVVWLGAELYEYRESVVEWWRGEYTSSADTPPDVAQWDISWLRIMTFCSALPFVLLAWTQTANNQFRFWGFWGWVLSIALVVAAVAPSSWMPDNLWHKLQSCVGRLHVRGNKTLWAILLIMAIGAFFRLYNLDGMPPQMTSDHKEKLLDAQRVLEGRYSVFFPNNGGREGFQMYALALLSYVPGLGINHLSLKILAVIESLVTLPVLWWMGREVVGKRDRRLGNTVGLILMALVAVSYWHVAITRVALRIVLTPLVAALLIAFLARGMRYNRRGDFILAGLTLGFGLYTYQAVRMLPVVVLAGVGLAGLWHIRSWRVVRQYIFHLVVLIVVAFVVFVPLFRFSTDYPELFWMRANGRILGEPVVEDVDAEGHTIFRDATFQERFDAFSNNMTILAKNIQNALLMFHWRGDEAWFHGYPHHPEMDIFTGGLLILGGAAWLVLILHRRDPVYVLIPLVVFIMLLPSALSIARPTENPSATRTSGALPAAYLMAALPLALVVIKSWRILTGRTGALFANGVVVLFVLGAYVSNSTLYFDRYYERYRTSTWPYSEPGAMLKGFAMSDGSYGNAFMISYAYWWDSTIVGMEAGILDWPNGINIGVTTVETFVRDAFYCAGRAYPVEPDRDLLFFYNYQDDESEAKLQKWFPDGRATHIKSYHESYDYKIYRVPALGVDGLMAFIEQHAEAPTCAARDF